MGAIDSMIIYTKIIPAVMIFCLVFFNIRKMQKRASAMKQVHSCGGSCAGCSHSASCSSAEKKSEDKTEE